MLILIEHFEYRNSKAAVAVLARFTGKFLSDLCLCAKAYVFIRGRGGTAACVAPARVSVTATCVCLSVYLSACFCGLNPRTVPQLSLIKFRASLGYRGFVLGLNVSYFFRSLGTSNGARGRANSTNGSHRHNYVTENCGQCWPTLDTRFCASMFFCCCFLGVAVDAT